MRANNDISYLLNLSVASFRSIAQDNPMEVGGLSGFSALLIIAAIYFLFRRKDPLLQLAEISMVNNMATNKQKGESMQPVSINIDNRRFDAASICTQTSYRSSATLDVENNEPGRPLTPYPKVVSFDTQSNNDLEVN